MEGKNDATNLRRAQHDFHAPVLRAVFGRGVRHERLCFAVREGLDAARREVDGRQTLQEVLHRKSARFGERHGFARVARIVGVTVNFDNCSASDEQVARKLRQLRFSLRSEGVLARVELDVPLAARNEFARRIILGRTRVTRFGFGDERFRLARALALCDCAQVRGVNDARRGWN